MLKHPFNDFDSLENYDKYLEYVDLFLSTSDDI